jgi:peptide/nickel transport system substrate-binding protein
MRDEILEQVAAALAATDIPTNAAYSPVGQQLLQSCGLNVDYQASDWDSLLNRWNAKENTGKGAWNCFVVGWAGLWITNPGSHLPLHYHKANPKMEALTELWFDAPDLPAQQKVAQDMQRLVFDDPPFIPLGQYFVPQAMRQSLIGGPGHLCQGQGYPAGRPPHLSAGGKDPGG